jgi:hypothetical protein
MNHEKHEKHEKKAEENTLARRGLPVAPVLVVFCLP